MTSTATRAIVIAHARPFIGPFMATAGAFVVVAVPSHFKLSKRLLRLLVAGPKSVVTPRNEVQIPTISQKL